MNDKRDEVIIQIEAMWDELDYDESSIEPTADLILSRETELRRQIADELEQIVWASNSDVKHKAIGDLSDEHGTECLVCEMCEKVASVYEKLRGKNNG